MNGCACMYVCVWVCGHLKKVEKKMEQKIRSTSIGDFERQLYISNVLCNASYRGKVLEETSFNTSHGREITDSFSNKNNNLNMELTCCK